VRRAAVLLLIVFVLIVFCAILAVNSMGVVQRLARITAIRGAVEMKAPGTDQFEPVTEEQNARAGTIIRTGRDGHATLFWPGDGTRLRVDPGTTLTIDKCQFGKRQSTEVSQFALTVGRVWVQVVKMLSAESKFEISTPTATAGVRGTTFSIEVAPDGRTDILVYEGQVEVQAKESGNSFGVKQGYAIDVANGGNADLRELDAKEKADSPVPTEASSPSPQSTVPPSG